MDQEYITKLSGPKLVALYNKIVNEHKPEGYKPTKRFSTNKAGITRVKAALLAVKDADRKAFDERAAAAAKVAEAAKEAKAVQEDVNNNPVAEKKGKAIAAAINPKTKPKKGAKKAKKAKEAKKEASSNPNTIKDECGKIWDKVVTPSLSCRRMTYIHACEAKGLSRWAAVQVWGQMAQKHNITNPTALANERNPIQETHEQN